jgi:hypothetical protein
MENKQNVYILNPDGSINFYNIAFYTALTRQDWTNNPDNQQHIEQYSDKLIRPFHKSDVEILKTKYNFNIPYEFNEYICKISREFIIGDFPIGLKYEVLEEAAKNSKYRLVIDDTNGVLFNMDSHDREKIEKVMLQIGLLKTGERDYIYLGDGKYKGSIWRSSDSDWKMIYNSFRDYILSPFILAQKEVKEEK